MPLRAIAAGLEDRVEALARLMAEEMGKPLPQGRAEIHKCAAACRYAADHAATHLAEETVDLGEQAGRVVYRPLGLVLAVMPWNFPFWQVLRCLGPVVMAGNGLLVKHAPSVQGCAAALEDLVRTAGLPDGLFANLVQNYLNTLDYTGELMQMKMHWMSAGEWVSEMP